MVDKLLIVLYTVIADNFRLIYYKRRYHLSRDSQKISKEVDRMDQTKFKASCPVCGRNLFRGSTHSYMEGNCPKCGSFLQITFHDTGVSAVTGPPAQAAKAESFKTE